MGEMEHDGTLLGHSCAASTSLRLHRCVYMAISHDSPHGPDNVMTTMRCMHIPPHGLVAEFEGFHNSRPSEN